MGGVFGVGFLQRSEDPPLSLQLGLDQLASQDALGQVVSTRLVADSALEGDGFEPSAPVAREAGLYCGREAADVA